MEISRIRFNNRLNADFVKELRKAVDDYFTSRSISTYANAAMVIKTICMISLYVVPYILIMTGNFGAWASLGFALLMGLGATGIGFAVAHDALHNAYSKTPWVNKLIGLSFNFLGANDYFWKIKHNVRHHTYTNIYEKDEDIDAPVSILRLSPQAQWKRIHRIQPFIAVPLYSMLSLSWTFYTDFNKLFTYNGHGSPNPDVKHPVKEVVRLIVYKLIFLFMTIALPIMVLPFAWWQVLIGFVAMQMLMGVILSVVFQLAHIVEETEFPAPDEKGDIEAAWVVHQLNTTANFAVRNPVITWFVGGLNFQVEHHLFPNICSIHYYKLSRVVEAKAREFGMTYHNHHSLLSAIRSHFKTLRNLSRPDFYHNSVTAAA
jgi:linoleoyl-CoA desaturase